MSMLNGIATLVALLTFIGIVWWAYSRGRSKANRDASLLPFAQPDEAEQAARKEAEAKARNEAGEKTGNEAQENARNEAGRQAGGAEQKKQGESHE